MRPASGRPALAERIETEGEAGREQLLLRCRERTAGPASDVTLDAGDGGEPAIVRFDDCELDVALHELRRGGQRVHVEPQVFDVLAMLVRRRGSVVTKNELLDEVWGDRFVSAAALSSRIAAARKATGDDGKAQRVIRTVHGRGFTFVAETRPS